MRSAISGTRDGIRRRFDIAAVLVLLAGFGVAGLVVGIAGTDAGNGSVSVPPLVASLLLVGLLLLAAFLLMWNVSKKMAFLAFYDPLTGLPGRELAQRRLAEAVQQAGHDKAMAALLFLDLDNFKAVNDSFGRAGGDRLLKEVAARLRTCVGDRGTVSRHERDEFSVVLGGLRSTQELVGVLESILHGLGDPIEMGSLTLVTSASVGISVYPEDGDSFTVLARKADKALAQAKQMGHNNYRFFDPRLDVDSFEILRLKTDLRRALDNGEFELHYQPQIDLASGLLVGAEALIRWNHPKLGLIFPDRFIGLAEETGLIVPMGDWVLRQACRQAAEWQDLPVESLVVAVNISAMQFMRGNLEQMVREALDAAALPPNLLELELTETTLMRESDALLSTIGRLKDLGLTLSIDDFGTGYSSFAYLRRFKVAKLKIDRSFVRGIADGPEDAAIVNSIIRMAKTLNVKTIAEGVEDRRTLYNLEVLGCDEAQGYLFAKPLPVREFEDFARMAASVRHRVRDDGQESRPREKASQSGGAE